MPKWTSLSAYDQPCWDTRYCTKQNKNPLLGPETEHNPVDATNFYKNLFGPAPGNLFKMEQNSWGVEEKLSEEDNNILEQPV